MNISIFASIGAQNLGDELILKNEIELLRKEFGPHPNSLLNKERETSKASRRGLFFQVASYDPKNPVFQIPNTQYFEYFPIGIKYPKNILRNIKNFLKFFRVMIWSDIVVIGGGGIIYDSEMQSVQNPLNQWIFRTKIARFLRRKLYFYALGIDIKNLENQKKLGKIFKNAWKITVRDEKSQIQLEKIGIQSELVDDPVIYENPHPNPLLKEREQTTELSGGVQPLSPGGERIQEGGFGGKILKTLSSQNFSLKDFENIDFSGKRVGLALRKGYIGKSGDVRVEKKLIEEFCSFIEKKGGRIIFLPHSIHATDELANDYEFMKQFLNYDRGIYASLGEVYTAYTHHMIDLMISMRLHSIILSCVYGIPQIVLSYSQKTDEVIKKLKN